MDVNYNYSSNTSSRRKNHNSRSSPSSSSASEIDDQMMTMGSDDHEEGQMDLRRGPWTVEEDLTLVNYIASHGEGRWNSLARCAGLKRTGKSCRLRWLNYLRPDVRRGNITLEEQLLILELHSRWGNRWSKIAQYLPGRTDNEIKNYWRTRVQKHAKQLNCDVNSKQFKDTMRYLWMPRLVERIQAAAASHNITGAATTTTTHTNTNNTATSSAATATYNPCQHFCISPHDHGQKEFTVPTQCPPIMMNNNDHHHHHHQFTSAVSANSNITPENSAATSSDHDSSFGTTQVVSPDHHFSDLTHTAATAAAAADNYYRGSFGASAHDPVNYMQNSHDYYHPINQHMEVGSNYVVDSLSSSTPPALANSSTTACGYLNQGYSASAGLDEYLQAMAQQSNGYNNSSNTSSQQWYGVGSGAAGGGGCGNGNDACADSFWNIDDDIFLLQQKFKVV